MRFKKTFATTLTASVAIMTSQLFAGGGAVALAAPGCERVQILSVPGTGEIDENADPSKPIGMLAGIQNGLKSKFGNKVNNITVPYSASIVSKGLSMNESVKTGEAALKGAIEGIEKKCGGDVSYVLTGYSQGSIVAGNVAWEIGNGKGVIPADKLIGVYTLADPKRGPQMDNFTTGEDGGWGVDGDRGSYGALKGRIGTGCITGGPNGPDMYCSTDTRPGAAGTQIANVVMNTNPGDIASVAATSIQALQSVMTGADLQVPDLGNVDLNNAASAAQSIINAVGGVAGDTTGSSSSSSAPSSSSEDSKDDSSESTEKEKTKIHVGGGELDTSGDRGKTADTNADKNDSKEQGGFDKSKSSNEFKNVKPGASEQRGPNFGGGSSAIDNVKPDYDALERNQKSQAEAKEEAEKPSTSETPSESTSGGSSGDGSALSDMEKDADAVLGSVDAMEDVNSNINAIAGNPENRAMIEKTLRQNGQGDAADLMGALGGVDFQGLKSSAGLLKGDASKGDIKKATETAASFAGFAGPIASLAGADSSLTGALGALTPATAVGQASNLSNGLLDTDWEGIAKSIMVLGQKMFSGDIKGAHLVAKHIEEQLLPLVTMIDGVDYKMIAKFVALAPTPEALLASAALGIFEQVDITALYRSTQSLTEALWKLAENPIGNFGPALNDAINGAFGYLQTGIKAFTGGVKTGDVEKMVTSGTDIAAKNAGTSSSSSSSSSSKGSTSTPSTVDMPKIQTAPGASLDPASVVADLSKWASFGAQGAGPHMDYDKVKFTTGKNGIEQGVDYLGKFISQA